MTSLRRASCSAARRRQPLTDWPLQQDGTTNDYTDAWFTGSIRT
jgi:membrane peptidoglycan carboxypeptidase